MRQLRSTSEALNGSEPELWVLGPSDSNTYAISIYVLRGQEPSFQQTALGQLNIHMQKNGVGLLFYPNTKIN
jgi:hypothetical protein